jgi:hypothetical protein
VLAARRACPPEDVGGPHGFEEFLRVMATLDDPEHSSVRDWYGGPFNPEAYDIDEVNGELERLRLRRAPAGKRRRAAAVPAPASAFPIPDDEPEPPLAQALDNPEVFLSEAEVRFLAGVIRQSLGAMIPDERLGGVEDALRWRTVQMMCERRRADLGLTMKDAARQLRAPLYRVVAVEKGELDAFELDVALRYFSLLGMVAFIARWARANPALARRLGLGGS